MCFHYPILFRQVIINSNALTLIKFDNIRCIKLSSERNVCLMDKTSPNTNSTEEIKAVESKPKRKRVRKGCGCGKKKNS